MKSIYIIIILLLTSNFCQAQKEFYNWYFGQNAGITFNPDLENPVALNDGQLISLEGCASISDNNGNLLFYTNGVIVWNQQHEIMENGTGLFGGEVPNRGSSSCQSSLIVKKPGSKNIYYLFTTDAYENRDKTAGLCYSEIDISENNGLGKVIKKNINLLANCGEKLSATLHANGNDIWVMGYANLEASFYAYLVTKDGIQNKAIISKLGRSDLDYRPQTLGQMKFSKDGNKFAHLYHLPNQGLMEIFDFDNQTGTLSNRKEINNEFPLYSLEFSPDGSKLYCNVLSGTSGILQYNIGSNNYEDFVIVSSNISARLSSLQLAPNSKIYIAQDGYLAVINYPNLNGKACKFQDTAVYLNNRICTTGLPNIVIIGCSIAAEMEVNKKIICRNDSTLIRAKTDEPSNYSFLWSTGDTLDYIYAKEASIYSVIITRKMSTCQLECSIEIKQSPLIQAELKTNKTTICKGDSTEIYIENNGDAYTYLWNTGETKDKITAKEAGVYSVVVRNNAGCEEILSIEIKQSNDINGNIKADKEFICVGDSTKIMFETKESTYTYLWNTGETTNQIFAKKAGTYSVQVANESLCYNTYEIIIKESLPIIAKFNIQNTVICNGASKELYLETDGGNYTYLWNTGETTNKITVDKADTYSVTVTNSEQCSESYSIEIKQSTPINVTLKSNKNSICSSEVELYLETDNTANYTYLWNTGETTDKITVDKAGTYSVVISNQDGCSKELELNISENTKGFTYSIDTIKTDFGANIRIKSSIKATSDESNFTLYNVNIIIKIAAQAFLPKGSNPNLIDQFIDNEGYRVLTFHFDSLQVTGIKKDFIALRGVVLLGDSLEYPINLVSFTYDNTDVCFEYVDGLLKMEVICEFDLRKLQTFYLSQLSLTSQESELKLSLKTQEEGNFELQVYNSMGMEIDQMNFSLIGNEVKEETLSIDMTNKAQGLYFIILKSPISTQVQKVFYQK